ncbi:sodium channel subunit beta-1 [Electrophorus electricus]|uniref:Sodium channel regulatory subunit beta-3 n=1 Tax=Electrophorus electricus TaxID=8005 RepID=A0A4W4FI68_ELEEL|nr:sodium channel subunit beta-1 [Electrophorus electricus]
MSRKFRPFLSLVMFFVYVGWTAPLCCAICVEVDSLTEAAAGDSFMLGCISCKRRQEVPGITTVDWHFKSSKADEFSHIFHYDYPLSTILHEDFEDRLEWHGTKGTEDIQIGAIFIHNVTFNDTGTFLCTFERTLFLPAGEEHIQIQKTVQLTVVPEAKRALTAVISEIMMYVVIVFLQLWIIGTLIYCYKKIYAENEAEVARKALAAQKELTEAKDNCDGVHLE